MKFKKALAVILAVAMVITLMPSMAFASTDNSVSRVYKVSGGDTFTAKLNLKNTGIDDVSGIFDITLDGAEWDITGDVKVAQLVTDSAVHVTGDALTKAAIAVTASAASGTAPIAISADKSSARVNMNDVSAATDEYVILFLKLKAKDNAEGSITVTISDATAGILSGTYTVATVASGKTVATVVGSSINKVSSDTSAVKGNTVKISETSGQSVKDSTGEYQAIRLTLPKNYTWKIGDTAATTISAILGGDMLPASCQFQKVTDAGLSTSSLPAIKSTVLGTGTPSSNLYWQLSNSDRSLELYFDANDQNYEQVLTVVPVFDVDGDASTGDVTLSIANIAGDISDAEGLVIAQNVVESVDVKTFSEITTVQSGLQNKNDSDKPYFVYVQLKENVKDALTSGKTITFEFPEEVQVIKSVGVDISDSSSATRNSTYTDDGNTIVKDTATKDASKFTWKCTASNSTKDTYTFKIPVSVEAGFTGDIECTVSGARAGIEETTVVVGTAVNPVTIEAATTDVKTGIQNQALSDIVITETAKGMLQADRKVELTIKDANAASLKNGSIEVTNGDIEVSGFDVTDNVIKFNIKSVSTKASTIKISGLNLSLDRTLAEGGYDLRVGGNAVVDNEDYDNKDFKDYSVAAASYINIVTPADSATVETKIDSQFVIGQSSYTNNGTSSEMDAAPYIDSNNRTMVPIRYIANACGVSDDNITWDQATQTATLNGTNTVVTIKVGSNTIQTSTGTITMDTVAVNNNGRIYVPARFIANALGANVTWDAATKTVGISK